MEELFRLMRENKLLTLVVSLFLIVLFILLIGIKLPMIVIDDNIESFSNEERTFAEFAIHEIRDNPREAPRLDIWTGLRAIAVNKGVGTSDYCEQETLGGIRMKNYVAIIRAYGLFGIAVNDVHIGCDGSWGYLPVDKDLD